MFRSALTIIAVMLAAAFAPQPPVNAPAEGVPLEVATDRSARITNVRYDLKFTISDNPAAPVRGDATIRFDLTGAWRGVVLDFAGASRQVTVRTGHDLAARLPVTREHIVIPDWMLQEGRNELSLAFESADAPLNRNPEFLYALFVPARARQAFPCFDQPDLKARYSVTLDVPAGWLAITNAPEVSREDAGSRTTVRFGETKPIPTYLFTFAAGRFQVETATRGKRQFRMLHRETDARKVARNRDAIFDLHAGALDWLEKYTGIEYPFGKFEFLLVPAFQFGGMEHPGSIFYNASALLLDRSATQNQKLGRASLIAHETAHMWFGDLVTMKWFNDVWMKEVFANFMAAKIVNPAFPEINHVLRFLYAHYPAAYDVDRTAGTNPIRQRLENLNEAGSLYGAIIYQKAPIVMRQLERLVGEDSFRDGLREYLRKYSFGNATWSDLIGILDRRTPVDLNAWSRAWVEEAGRPTITTDVTTDGKTLTSLAFVQTDPYEGRGLRWTQTLNVAAAYPDDTVFADVQIEGDRTVAQVRAPESAMPLYVLPNANGVGYGNFVLDPASRTYLLANLSAVPDGMLRGPALVTLWEEMVDGRVAAPALLDALVKSIPSERNELTLQRMLGYVQQAYWRWIPETQRVARAAQLEAVLRSGLDGAATESLKSAWFNALRDVAVTRPTLEWLERVWRKTESVPGLELAEADYITLAQELAVRGVPAADEIITTQIERTQNPDRKARLAFVKPALSRSGSVRDAFFATLKDPPNRRREAWVLDALTYLHHPLRAASAEKYVKPSLDLLREIQQTGDIFFPKRWMDATLSGHRSPAVAARVRTFIEALPSDYPDRLRRIVLSSSDDLFRITRTPVR